MELFSEIYSCYYQVLRHLLSCKDAMTAQDIYTRICTEGFEESMLSIIPKLENGAWDLFERDAGIYLSKLNSSLTTPLSNLEKSYLKALLSDSRIALFLTEQQLFDLKDMLSHISPLWKPEHFFYYDRFAGGDPYDDETYRHHFRLLLQAQKDKQYVDIDYNAPNGARHHHYYLPARLEYSVKNDKFRLLALKHTKGQAMRLELLNVSRIRSVQLTDKRFSSAIDLNAIIQNSYYKEPVRIRILNKRNALERAMLHFANYEKNTIKIDENTYECLIYYNQNMETELLIEVMSFGPMLTVIGNERFLSLLKARLQRQRKLAQTDHTYR
ncbi:MAG: WYL domain-containing protein [Lachnospiraceae bacterium]|nr:WYL domain-containing protein [Lachnospiraceae bacterium]